MYRPPFFLVASPPGSRLNQKGLNIEPLRQVSALLRAIRIPNLRKSRRMRRIGSIALALVVLFGLFGFVGAPLLLRHVVVGRVAKLLERRVDFSEASFNPYTLRLTIEKLHVGERSAASPFVDIGRLSVRASWASLFRLAPVIKTFAIDRCC